MAVLTNARGTLNANTENVRVRDASLGIKELEPDLGKLVTFMASIPGAATRAINPQVEWVEDEFNPRFDTLAANLTAGATTMEVSNYQYFKAGHLVKIANGEVVRVSVTPTTSDVTIVRAQGSTGAASASSGNQLFIMSTAYSENSALPALISTQKVVRFNYLQIMRDPFGLSQTAIDTEFYGEKNDRAYQKNKFMKQHKRDMENAIIHGERGIVTDTTLNQYLYMTGGVLEFITTNVTDAGGDLTELEWEDHIRKTFRFGSQDKVCFCSPKAISVLNGFGRGKIETKSGDSRYGITISRYEHAGKNVRLVEHNQLTNENLDDNTGIGGIIFTLDIKDIKLRYVGPVMTRFYENQEANGTHGKVDEFITHAGIEVHQERKHSVMEGITG